MPIDLEPCKTGHWWVQDGKLHVYCEYCPATGKVVIEGETAPTPESVAIELSGMFLEPAPEPIAQTCTRPGHMCGTKDAGPCNGLPRGGVVA